MNNTKLPAQNSAVGSEAFEIDVLDLVQPNARRPHHLESRIKSKKRPSPNATAERKAEAKRQALIDARRSKISERLSRVRLIVSRQRQQAASSLSDKQSHIEKSLQAAEKNRKALLKSQSSQYAAKVERAKKIASAHQQRSLEHEAKKRSELENRLWQTDFRRQLVQKLPRSKMMDETALDGEMMRANMAAKHLQRWWRESQFTSLVAGFVETGLDKASDMAFDVLMVKIQNPHTIQATSQLLQRAKKGSAHGHGKSYKNPTKIFLSSYMIVMHTNEIMPDVGAEEAAVKASAEVMLKHFNAWLAKQSFKTFDDFTKSWDVYHMLFDQWKKRDTDRLLASLADHFMQLERLWESVKGQPSSEEEWRPRIELQQKQIKDRVMRIGGKSAVKRLLTTQQEFRSASESEGDASDASSARHAESPSVMNSPYQARAEPVRPESAQAAIPPSEMNQTLSAFGAGMTNEQLAHELVLNPEFELKPNKDTQSMEAQIRVIAKKAFFDKMRQDVAENKYEWLAAILSDVKEQLLGMAPPKSKIHTEITESLDVDLIMQQVNAGAAIELPRYVQFITGKMLQLCAPVRDAEIRKLAELTDIVDIFSAILEVLEGMKLDLANFRLRTIRPHLMKQAAEYERSKFEQALEAGRVTLEKTKEWLTTSIKSVQQVAAARNPENISIPENRIRYDAVFFDALMSLIFSSEPISRETCPESLMMDAERLFAIQNEHQAVTVVAALIMLTRNFVAEIRDDRDATKQLKDGLFVLLQDGKTTVEHLTAHIVTCVNEALARSSKSLTDEKLGMIRTMVDKTLSYKDTVYSLLNRRLAAMIRIQLTSGRFRRDSNTGLDVVADEIEALSRKVFLLAKHNRDVFAPWYDQIIQASV